MTFGSRPKGARAELEIAELLRAWWDPLEPGCIFKRTPGSGGWSSPQARAEFRTSGDLVTTARRFRFCVEVKRREQWSDATLLAGRKSPVWKWWKQACKAALESGGDTPLLIFRRSRRPWMAMVSVYAWSASARSLITPVRWDSRSLESKGVDYGDRLPVMFALSQLLETRPEIWARMEL